MKRNKMISITVVTLLMGFMLAIQFQSTKSTEVRDTRDMWELREDYLKAKEMETKLLKDIRINEEKITKYEQEMEHGKEQLLKETVEELRMEAGLKEERGPGLVITIQAAYNYIPSGYANSYISSDLLRRLINELNTYGAKDIAIAEQRVVNTTVIREIQGETKIDGYPLRNLPFEIKVIAPDFITTKKLYNMMQISTIADSFFIDNLTISISEPMNEVVVPAYSNKINLKILSAAKEEGGK